MKYVNKKDLSMSVFSLGTVQLGTNYGMVGKTEKPTEEYAHAILNAAMESGVNMLDTANNYGDSERVIGSWLKTYTGEKPLIVTKIGRFDHSSKEALRADIRAQTEACLKSLGVDTIDILMAHYYWDYIQDPEVVKEEFARLKKEGLARLTAISLYSEDDYHVIAGAGFDAVQIPLNIFDQERILDGGIKAMADAGMAIFTRSVFLQGLVFMDPENLMPHMSFLKDTLVKFRSLAKEFDMAPEVLAVSYVLSVEGVSSVALGCQTPEQIKANADMVDKARHLTDAEMKKITETFKDIDRSIIDPRNWPKA